MGRIRDMKGQTELMDTLAATQTDRVEQLERENAELRAMLMNWILCTDTSTLKDDVYGVAQETRELLAR